MTNKKATILIVDDTDYNLIILSTMLGNQGYPVLEANNGFDAIEIAKSQHPDLILLDVKMPEIDGYQSSNMVAARRTTP